MLFFEDFTDNEAFTSLCVTTITSINPTITRKTMLIAINDITRAPMGPVKLELIETISDISITSNR